MDQLTVVGRRSVANDLLVSLQSLGVVQVDPLETTEDVPLERLRLADADRAQKDGWDAAVARSAGAARRARNVPGQTSEPHRGAEQTRRVDERARGGRQKRRHAGRRAR